MFEWDEGKAAANWRKHGVAFDSIAAFDWDTADVERDRRDDYGEPRWIAVGLIGDRVHVAIYTMRGRTMRLISLRKANRREVGKWLRKNG